MPNKTYYFLRKPRIDEEPNAIAGDSAQEAEQPMKGMRKLMRDKNEISKAKAPENPEDCPVTPPSGSHLLLAFAHDSFSVNFKAYPNLPIVTNTVKL